MIVRFATDTFVKVMKRVWKIRYTLEEVRYDDEFIMLELDDNFDVTLVQDESEAKSLNSSGRF